MIRVTILAVSLAFVMAAPALAQSAGPNVEPGVGSNRSGQQPAPRNVKNFDKPRRDYMAIQVTADPKPSTPPKR